MEKDRSIPTVAMGAHLKHAIINVSNQQVAFAKNRSVIF